MTEAEQTQDWRELLYPAEHDPVLVAKTDGGEIIGYALGKVDSVDFERWQGELAALHVLRHHQRQGVGSRLFAAMAQELARHEKTGLALWTLEGNPVRTFYERLGGKLAKEKFYDVDNITITEVAYLWDNVFELIERLELRNGAN
jgi:GNAT superfamily N-acetyltransferase